MVAVPAPAMGIRGIVTTISLNDLLANEKKWPTKLPDTLQHLESGSKFNHRMDNVILPMTWKTLRFGEDFNQKIERSAEQDDGLTLVHSGKDQLEQPLKRS